MRGRSGPRRVRVGPSRGRGKLGAVQPPPPGPPWDLPVSEAPLAFVDLEMTGLDAKCDRVVEICVERVVGNERVAFVSTLVDPGERVGGAAHVHGIDAVKIAGAPRFADIAS